MEENTIEQAREDYNRNELRALRIFFGDLAPVVQELMHKGEYGFDGGTPVHVRTKLPACVANEFPQLN